MKHRKNSRWDDRASNFVKAFYKAVPAREIAAKLTEMTDKTFTRNMVIACAGRLGLDPIPRAEINRRTKYASADARAARRETLLPGVGE